MWEKEEKGRERGEYEFVDSVDEAECFLRGVSLRECGRRKCGGVRTIALASFAAAVSVMKERGSLRAAGGGQRSAGTVERGGWSYRSTKALVNGRFSNLYRTSVRPPADPPQAAYPAHISSVSSRPPLLACQYPSSSESVSQSVSQTHIGIIGTSAPSPPPSLCTSPRSPLNRSIYTMALSESENPRVVVLVVPRTRQSRKNRGVVSRLVGLRGVNDNDPP